MFRQRMAVSAILLALVSGVPSVIAQSPSDHGGAAAQLVGRWKLVSLEAVRPNGEVVREWGPKPVGHLIYDASGFVAVQIVRDPRAAGKSDNLTPDQRREAFDTYYAYFGAFEVDDQEKTVVHHIHGSLRPYEAGVDLKRYFKLSGNRLELSTAPLPLEAGESRVYRLTWERAN